MARTGIPVAFYLKSATTIIDVFSATAPTSGQVLTATSSTTATWQTPNAGTATIVNDVTTNASMFPVWVTANTGSLPLKVSSTKLFFNPSTALLTIDAAGTGTVLTAPIIQTVNSIDNFTQIATQNKSTGVNSSADHIVYPNNNANDITGFTDMGVTGSAFAQAAYIITAPNDSYLFASAVSGAGKVGNLIIATDATGSSNNIVFYTGGFDSLTRERMRITATGVRFGLIGTSTGTLLFSGATSGTTTLVANTAAGSGTLTLPVATDTLVGKATTDTLTNKRHQPRIVSAASYTTDTGTSLDVSTCDNFIITAQAGALLFNSPSGTPVQGEKLIIRIKDNGTARALTWNAIFRAIGTALPSTTVLSKTLYLGLVYNSTDTKWDLIASAQEA